MTSCTARLGWAALAWAVCSGPAQADYAAESRKLASAAPNDSVLYTLQAGLAALSEGKTDAAGQLFDRALTSIEGMFANSENAAKARSLWYEEGAKDFKGEPYERAMAFYYRGLLYLADGDYENARASFRGGLLQDAFSEEGQHQADFAGLMLLEGWSNQLNGDAGAAGDAYREVARLRPGWKAPAAGDNVLIIAELGGGPRKLGDGIGNREIVYRRAKRTPETAVDLGVDGRTLPLPLVEDVFFQASTRGGRPIDAIIDGKVSFKNNADAVGNVLGKVASEGSLISSASGGGGGRALGSIAAIGAIASLVSANVKPRADVRYWNNLPQTLHMLSLRHDGPLSGPTAALRDDKGQPVADAQPRIQQWRDKNGNTLIWLKSRN
jgi:tetratricopeptide (TPR) repeat protein